jgi:ankyrin repeat protein
MAFRDRMHPIQTHRMVRASISGDAEEVRARIENGANPNVRLHIGVFNGLEFEYSWHTPLMIARYQASLAAHLNDPESRKAYTEVENVLIKRGAEMQPRDLLDIEAAARRRGFRIIKRED